MSGIQNGNRIWIRNGMRLADVLTRELPKLNEKKAQRLMRIENESDIEGLQKAIEAGERVVASMPVRNTTFVVLEK